MGQTTRRWLQGFQFKIPKLSLMKYHANLRGPTALVEFFQGTVMMVINPFIRPTLPYTPENETLKMILSNKNLRLSRGLGNPLFSGAMFATPRLCLKANVV